MNYLVVRGSTTVKVHLSEVAMLMVESTAVSLTAALLCELTKRKIKVIFCDEKRNPHSELIPQYGSHDASAKIKTQMSWSDSAKNAVWTRVITEKIARQNALLKAHDKPKSILLDAYLADIAPGDATNREGLAAKVYFHELFGLEFQRGLDIPINMALNFGYSLLLSAFNREIVAAGYLTQLGIFHDNAFNPFNLSSDLMEPYRPLVDQIVHARMPKEWNRDEKIALLHMLHQEVMICQRKQTVLNSIKIYVKSVFDALEANDVDLLRFFAYEFSIYAHDRDV